MTGGDGADFGTHQAHPGDVEGLALHVHLAHVNDAFHAEAGADGGGGDAMLAGSGFRDDAFFPESFGEQDLAERVVDLVGTGVEQVLAFQVNLRAAEQFGPAFGEVERSRAADVVVKQVIEFRLECGVVFRGLVGSCEFLKWGHQGFRHKHAAELAEVAGGIRNGGRK